MISIQHSNREHLTAQLRSHDLDANMFDAYPENRPLSTFSNLPEYININATLYNRQYDRYRARGGRLPPRAHEADHRFNSPNHRNMTPGHPYRTHFHRTVTPNYYSLGEATHLWNTTHNHRTRTTTSPPNAHTIYDLRVQSHAETIYTAPTEPSAIIDSGAMMTTCQRRELTGTEWAENLRPAKPGTSIRYGNLEIETVEQIAIIGDYVASIVPDSSRTALISTHDIVERGHTITLSKYYTTITDEGGKYILHLPRMRESKEWRVPIRLLQRLSDLRARYPLEELQPIPSQRPEA